MIGIVLTVLNVYVIIVRSHQLHIDPKATIQAESTPFLELGLSLSALVVVGLIVKRRALLGFAAFFVGLIFLEYGVPTEFFFSAAYGSFLLIRAQKAQKLQRASNPKSAVPRNRTPKSTSSPPTSKKPTPSKRYTPPKRPHRSGQR
jgi:hypothetical protein